MQVRVLMMDYGLSRNKDTRLVTKICDLCGKQKLNFSFPFISILCLHARLFIIWLHPGVEKKRNFFLSLFPFYDFPLLHSFFRFVEFFLLRFFVFESSLFAFSMIQGNSSRSPTNFNSKLASGCSPSRNKRETQLLPPSFLSSSIFYSPLLDFPFLSLSLSPSLLSFLFFNL